MSDPKLETFLRTIRNRVLDYAALRLPQEEQALDLLQETMIDFVAAADEYPHAAWQALFYQILNRRIAEDACPFRRLPAPHAIATSPVVVWERCRTVA